MSTVTGYIDGTTVAGVPAPILFTDNGNGTFSPNIAAALTLDPTNLSLETTQQDVLTALTTGVVRTFTLTAATSGGSVAAGAKSVAFSSSSDFAGTITGATFAASQAIGAAVDGADTIGAIAYTVSAGTLYIGKVV